MAIHKFCIKCRSAKPMSTIGTNGICKDCMIDAIEANPQVKEEMGKGTEAKAEAFTMSNGDEKKVFGSKRIIADHFEVTIQKVNAAFRYKKDIEGWKFV